MGVSAVLPNYNGVDLLREYLPTVLDALKQWGGAFEILVVDDCSSDGSLEVLAREFSEVKVLVNEQNLGFSGTCNHGIAEARYPILLCINTDVRMEPDSVAPLLRHFENPEVFAVTPNVLVEREGVNQGVMTGIYRKGFVKGRFWPLGRTTSEVRENLYAVGACVAYRTEMLRELRGYAEMYAPYIFEDVDLSFRAWKRGWSSLYEPASTVHHYANGTIGRAKKRKRRIIYFRNRFLFHWSNLTDPSCIAANAFYTAFRLLFSWLVLDFRIYPAFWGALGRWREVKAARAEVKRHLRLSDHEVFRRTCV